MRRKGKIGCLLLILSTTSLVTAANSTLDDIRKFNLTLVGGFDRTKCYIQTLDYVRNGTLDRNSEVFSRYDNGTARSGDEDITLTLLGCRALCGENQAWFWDIGPRITAWLIPVLLLISNMELSPLDKRRFFAILHLLGDPIDSIWSLVHKIDAWDQCYTLAGDHASSWHSLRRVIATVFAGVEEVMGPEVTEDYLHKLVKMRGHKTHDKYREWRLAAVELADSRSDEILRTMLAIILYLYQVIASFVEEVGGSQSSPPGGRIGTAMFVSWLVPLVLLSNSIGGFTSRRSASNILNRFAEKTGLPLDFLTSKKSKLFQQRVPDETDYIDSLGWCGAIYTFRTWKTRYLSGEPDRWRTGYLTGKPHWWRTVLIFCISIAPICIAMSGAFVIIWHTVPIGFTCRHFWVISLFTLYWVSLLITWISHSDRFVTGFYHFYFVQVKDFFFGMTSLIMIFLSSSGLFNSCKCFSGYYFDRSHTEVFLNSAPFYARKNDTIYPAVVAVCLFLQLLVFVAIAAIWWNGLQLMRWSEKARAAEWKIAGGGTRAAQGQELVDMPLAHSQRSSLADEALDPLLPLPTS